MIVAADEELAEQMLRHVRHILETHALTKNLRPVKKTLWASDRLQVKRRTVSRDPSVRAAGITSNITGSRADLIICDDVEVPKTCDTHGKRMALRQRLNELDFILTPEGMIMYIGTPHTEDSLYAEDGFLKAYHRLQIPLDEFVWPQRFTPQTIDNLRVSVGPRIFASQMQLQNTAITDARLDPELLNFYFEETLPYTSRCVWDPAFGHENGDQSVVALVYQDHAHNLYLHDVLYLKKSSGDEAAAQQCKDVIAFLQKHDLHHLIIETNGLGQFLPGLLRRALKEQNYPCSVQNLHQSKAKNLRILQAFEARLAAKAVYVHMRIKDTAFIREMRDWNPDRTDNNDDALDAASTAIHLLPNPLSASKQFFIQEEFHD